MSVFLGHLGRPKWPPWPGCLGYLSRSGFPKCAYRNTFCTVWGSCSTMTAEEALLSHRAAVANSSFLPDLAGLVVLIAPAFPNARIGIPFARIQTAFAQFNSTCPYSGVG